MATPPRPLIASSFVRKLYTILKDDHGSIISWDETGTTFSVFDIELLVQRVLPLYFRGRLDAFRQQLREHGFQHVGSTQHGRVETYRHPHFERGNPEKLSLIVRTPLPRKRDRRAKSTKERRSFERLSSSSVDLSSSVDSAVLSPSSETYDHEDMIFSDDEKSFIFEWLEPNHEEAQPAVVSSSQRRESSDFVQVDHSEVPPNSISGAGGQPHAVNEMVSQPQARARARYSQLSVDMLEMLLDFFSMTPSGEASAASDERKSEGP